MPFIAAIKFKLMPVKILLISALELAINRFIKLDEEAPILLAPLCNKVIAIHIQPFDSVLYLCPGPDTIQVIDQYFEEPDATMSGTPAALSLMGMSSKPMRSIFSGQVRVEGDLEVAGKFQQLFDKLEIDPEEQLSHITGDLIAHKIGRFFYHGKSWTEQSINTFQLNLSEFLQEETRDLPAQPEMDIFLAQVDSLRSDYDRLQARISRLESMLQ